MSVLLLDEVEKASPDVFDILLSLLDEGRLTDRYGQTTSFRSCVIIMTSNIGVRRGGSLGFNEESSVDFRAEIRRAFRPEFLVHPALSWLAIHTTVLVVLVREGKYRDFVDKRAK